MYTYEDDLVAIGKKHKTDKWGSHWYLKHYNTHFSPLRFRKLNLLEIGIGGYEEPTSGGESLRMWAEYFPFAEIFGIDVIDKSPHDSARVHTSIINQTDIVAVKTLSEKCGGFDIIIDDGSHLSEHVVESFAGLFPILNPGGIYAIEDTQTSYWPKWQGTTAQTSMEMVKSLVDGINYKEIVSPNYNPTYSDRNVTAIHVYHSLVFIQKGDNWEESNVVSDNKANNITGSYELQA